MPSLSKSPSLLLFTATAAFIPALAQAQNTPAKAPAKTPAQAPAPAQAGKFTYSAAKLTYRSNGVRLEGTAAAPARISSPELTVVAPTIAFDLAGNTISEVRAVGGVDMKVNLTPKGGGPMTHIESKSTTATLQTTARKLLLNGNLSGFYQSGDGPKNTLAGDNAILSYQADKSLLADINGGNGLVTIQIPAESLGKPDAMGPMTLTAQHATINQSTGEGTFSGNAHAVATGPNAFDLTATQFTLSRANDGALGILKTTGKTTVKYDVPPDAAPATEVKTDATANAPATSKFGKPTHIEVTADAAVFDRATSTATFTGHVTGFYRLSPTQGDPQNYTFSGDKAVIHYDSTVGNQAGNANSNAQNGLNVEVTGAPVVVDAPAFNSGLQ